MNKYYNAFQDAISWFNFKKDPVEVFEIKQFKSTKKFQEIFPVTANLIDQSTKTGVVFNEKSLILFTWEIGQEISGWMCQFDNPRIEIIEEHKILIDNIGGIIESFNGPEGIDVNGITYNYSLTLNQNFMYVGSMCDAKMDWEDYYKDRCKSEGFLSMDLSDSVFFTQEANGARTFYDRKTKKITLFSHDHAFKFVDFISGQPERTMYKIKGVENFVDYVELTSKQWDTYFENKRGLNR